MRMTPTRVEVASSGDVTRVSDTVGHRTQAPLTSTGNIAYEAPAKVDEFGGEQSRHITSLLEKVSTPILLFDAIDLTALCRLIILKWSFRIDKIPRNGFV